MASSPGASACAHVARIGVVFGQRSQLWWDLPVIDGFDLLRDIYRVPRTAIVAIRDELVALLRLERAAAASRCASCRSASGCAARSPRRCCTSRRCSSSTSRPSASTRRPSSRCASSCGRLNRERGVTVILTTHDMHDIEALAERVIVIGGGADPGRRPVRDAARRGAGRAAAVRGLRGRGAGAATGRKCAWSRARAAQLELAFDPASTPAAALIARIVAAHAVDDIHVEEPLIEEVIARFYEHTGRARRERRRCAPTSACSPGGSR